MLNNPFVIAGKIPAQYFCDRIEESNMLAKYIINHNNVVLISPRRMGKSGLIHHCFGFNEFKEDYATIYFDILQTTCLKEFVYLFGKTVYENIVPKTTRWINRFFQTLKTLQGKISYDPIAGYPSFNMMLGEIKQPDLTLDEIFKFIENHNKRVVIAIDEFQQIAKYPEKNIEAILRSQIQRSGNVNFIYSGSERHLMQEMFTGYARPFYQSATIMELLAIPKQIYVEFATIQFSNYSKSIDKDVVSYVYDLFSGYTYYMQKILHNSFFETKEGSKSTKETVDYVITQILEEYSIIYRELLSNMGERQKEVLYAIALEGKCESITSSSFIKKYNLLSASSVQAATRQLLAKDYITKAGKTYEVTDKFLALWIKRMFGFLT